MTRLITNGLESGSSCDELASATLLSNAFLSSLGELLGSDDADTGWELTLAEDLEVSLKWSNIEISKLAIIIY